MNIKKQAGYFEKILAIDAETTGLDFNNDDPSNGHQAVSWGIVVADTTTLKPVEELYVEIKWNQESKQRRMDDPRFGKKAESIHGLTFEYLEEHGMEEKDAVLAIANLIIKYWGPTNRINCLGHNVHVFDVPFLKSLFRRHKLDVLFSSRHCDSNSVGFTTVGAYTSNALFETMGFDPRDSHNALEDAKMSLESCRQISVLWKEMIQITSEN